MAEYVNNKKFFEEYCIWKKSYRQALLENKERPQISRYLGECVLLICNNLGMKGNFSGYSYLDEMREDAIEACFKGFASFDETKYVNIFAYFTQVAFHAMVLRIKKEKKQQKIKIALIKDMMYEGICRQEFDNEDYQVQMREIILSTVDSNSRDDRLREIAMSEYDTDEEIPSEEIETNKMDIYGDD